MNNLRLTNIETHNLNKIVEDIENRTGIVWDKMSITDRLMYRHIMRKLKADIDKELAEKYYVLEQWSNLSLNDVFED